MKIAVLGTGMVGQAHAAKLISLGYEVMMGTHDVAKTLAKKEKDAMGNPPFAEWYKNNAAVKLGTFDEAAAFGEIILEALHGEAAVEVLKSINVMSLDGKVLVDIANPLDFSKGMPPTLTVCNTDSLGEQIQQALPRVRVVKSFNTTNAVLQVNPEQLAGGDHNLFVSGNDAEAKATVMKLQKEYGWKHIIDLGDITTARGTEMLMPFWLRLWGSLKTPMFNYKIIQ